MTLRVTQGCVAWSTVDWSGSMKCGVSLSASLRCTHSTSNWTVRQPPIHHEQRQLWSALVYLRHVPGQSESTTSSYYNSQLTSLSSYFKWITWRHDAWNQSPRLNSSRLQQLRVYWTSLLAWYLVKYLFLGLADSYCAFLCLSVIDYYYPHRLCRSTWVGRSAPSL